MMSGENCVSYGLCRTSKQWTRKAKKKKNDEERAEVAAAKKNSKSLNHRRSERELEI